MSDYSVSKLKGDKYDLERVQTRLEKILTKIEKIFTERDLAVGYESDAFVSDTRDEVIEKISVYVTQHFEERHSDATTAVANAISNVEDLIEENSKSEYEEKCQEIYEREYNRLYG